jgi:hypothetical protein
VAKISGAARRERLAAALRANLKRRKAQARAKTAGKPSNPSEPSPHERRDTPDRPLSGREPAR